MKSKIILATFVLFFWGLVVHAQDTLKPIHKHLHKAQIHADSANVSHPSHETLAKDTAKLHKQHANAMPKYPRNGYVALAYGLGSPAGAYAQNEGALTGSLFSLSAALPGIISHWGVALKFDHGTNNINAGRLSSTLTNNARFPNISCSLPFTLGHCSYSSFLGGLYLTCPSRHITIDFRLLAGTMISTIPSLAIEYFDQTTGTSSLQYQGEASGSAFAIDFGVEARYPIMQRLLIFMSMDYIHADPSFPFVTTGAELTSNGGIFQGSGQEETASQAFSLFNFSVGAGYSISAKKQAVPKTN